MIKGVLNKQHGIVLFTMAGLFTQTNWIQDHLNQPNQFTKDALDYQMVHFINFSITGFFFPLTTSVLLLGLGCLRQYNHWENYDQKKQHFFQLTQMILIGGISFLGVSVPCRYILLNKHK